MHDIILTIIYASWMIVVLGLVFLLFIQLKNYYFKIIIIIHLTYLKYEPSFIEYVYQCSLSVNYNYFIFILTVGLTSLLKEVYFTLLDIYAGLMFLFKNEDLLDTECYDMHIYRVLFAPDDYPIAFFIWFLGYILFLFTIVIILISSWRILRIIYLPEYFRKS